MKTLRLLVAGTLILGVVACSSGAPAKGVAQVKAAPASEAASAPSLLALRAEASPAPRLVLETAGSPAYTSYSPQPDVFVVDLPGATRNNGLVIPTNLPSWVASVSADEAVELGTPLTRVTVRFAEPRLASVEMVEGSLSISFGAKVASAAPELALIPALIEEPPAVTVSDILPEPPPASGPARSLTRIEAFPRGGGIELLLEGDGALEYKAFKLVNPQRLVIDVKGVHNRVPARIVEVGRGDVRQVRVSQFSSAPEAVTRVVVDLDRPVEYRVDRAGTQLRVALGEVPAATAVVQPVAPPPQRVEPAAVERVEFRPPVEQAPKKAPVQTARIEPPKVQPRDVEDVFDEAPLPSVVPVVQKVSDVQPKPRTVEPVVRSVISAPMAQTAPMIPAPTPRREDVFDEPPIVRGPGTTTQLSGGIQPGGSRTLTQGERVFTGEPVDLTLKDADIRDVLRHFAQLTGLNIAIDPQVSGTVTVEFQAVPWDQALDLILRQNNLAYDIEGSVMRIGTVDRLSAEQAATRRRDEERRLSVPTTSVARRLSYARAGEIQGLLASLASPRGKIIVDERTNQIVITDIPDALRLMLNLIDTVDIPTPQVVIEARIVETTKTFSKQFGVSLGGSFDFDPALGSGTGLQFPNRINGAWGGPNSIFDLALGSTVFDISLSNVLGTFDLDILLAAAESEGLARVISAPRVATQDNQAAEIQSGIQIPFQTRVNFTTTVQFVDATLRLSVTPQITAENTVIMDIQVQKVEPAAALNVAGAENIPLITRRAQTRLMVRDGGTAVIGGIYQSSDSQGEDRVPILHTIPVLGNLFKNRDISQRHDELLIFITPRIVRTTN
jgi:type IV pilus assembly protein PilQ